MDLRDAAAQDGDASDAPRSAIVPTKAKSKSSFNCAGPDPMTTDLWYIDRHNSVAGFGTVPVMRMWNFRAF